MKAYKNWFIMLGTCAMILLVNLDMTIINIALPVMTKVLKQSLIHTQWIISSYLLAATVFFVICGRLADKLGKKNLFLLGTFLFLISSIVLSFSNELPLIICMRFIQGIGFASTLNLALLINAEIFPAEKRGTALGISITLTGIGQAFGPTIGGAILSIASWHWIFAINIPLCVAAIICVTIFFQEIIHQHAAVKFFDNQIFKLTKYNTILTVRSIFMFCWAVMLLCLPLYLQNYLDYTPLAAGFIIFSMTSIVGICSFMVGKTLDIIGAEKPLLIAILCAIASFILLMLSLYNHSMFLFFVSIILCGFNAGILIPSSVFAAMHLLPIEQKGFGLGVFFTLSFFSAACGTSMSSYLLVTMPSFTVGFLVITAIMLITTLISLMVFLNSKQLVFARVT